MPTSRKRGSNSAAGEQTITWQGERDVHPGTDSRTADRGDRDERGVGDGLEPGVHLFERRARVQQVVEGAAGGERRRLGRDHERPHGRVGGRRGDRATAASARVTTSESALR